MEHLIVFMVLKYTLNNIYKIILYISEKSLDHDLNNYISLIIFFHAYAEL